jgi:hypothetical protein
LNSLLQQRGGGWKGFHNYFLLRLSEALEPLITPTYYVANEQALQLGIYDIETDDPLDKPSLIVPDATIYRTGEVGKMPASSSRENPYIMTLPLTQTVAERESYIASLVIYQMLKGRYPGKPVTRIELLSPANKPSGSDYGMYMKKREETLYSHIRLVEIDFIHERRPILSVLPSYADQEQGGSPYYVIISDPRPTFQKGIARIAAAGVLDVLPVIDIPLDGTDTVTLDLGVVYNATVELSHTFRYVLVDYSQEPERFHTYTPDDQQRIRDHMAAIAANPPVDESATP